MSRSVIVQYQTHPDRADENARLVADVFAELAALDPAGFRYATHRLADGVTFVHVAQFDGHDNPLTAVAAFGVFQRDLVSRCAEPPVVHEGTLVGSYR